MIHMGEDERYVLINIAICKLEVGTSRLKAPI
jgi:hypothetical protein